MGIIKNKELKRRVYLTGLVNDDENERAFTPLTNEEILANVRERIKEECLQHFITALFHFYLKIH